MHAFPIYQTHVNHLTQKLNNWQTALFIQQSTQLQKQELQQPYVPSCTVSEWHCVLECDRLPKQK